MVRKWSYINKPVGEVYSLNSSTYFFHKFKFKVFRQHTRFKNYNFSNSSLFTRKQIITNKRKLGWKTYSFITKLWVKSIMREKKLLNFTQTVLLYKYFFKLPYINIFVKSTNLLSNIGVGKLPLTFTRPNLLLSKVQSTRFNRQNFSKLILLTEVGFTKLNTLDKLKQLGFPFLEDKSLLKLLNLPVHNFNTPNVLINTVNSIRCLHIYLILSLIKFKKINVIY